MVAESILEDFVRASNRIEGIFETRRSDVLAHKTFLERPVTVTTLSDLAYKVSGALLRSEGMNVRVGSHTAPAGGPAVVDALKKIIADLPNELPALTHQKYLWLHPFMDGNGRTARALWLHTMSARGDMGRVVQLGFLHAYYYQTLELFDRQVASLDRIAPLAGS